MSLCNYVFFNIINEVCDFFTEFSDIPITKDPIINRRMREILFENQHVNQLIYKEIYQSKLGDDDDTFDELCKIMSIGWFNYDRHTKQYSNIEMDDIINYTIGRILNKNSQLMNGIANDLNTLVHNLNL